MTETYTIPTAPEGFKSGFVGIIGRPNVGKSTLMNQLVGQKIAITSPVAQTTRNRLQGILTTAQAQIVFVDTPGIHKPLDELGKVLVHNARLAIESVDLVLFVVDSSTPAGKGDRFVAEWLYKSSVPVIIGLNKSDLLPESSHPHQSSSPENLAKTYQELAQGRDWKLTKLSAITGAGIPELQQIIIEQLETGPYYYPPDLVTDQPERFIMSELIREQIFLLTRQEIPHSVAVSIERIQELPKLTHVYAAINVERESQKGIIIGKNGSMLKNIGTAARQQIQKLIAGKVYLELFVKVEVKWRHSRLRLAQFGYQVES